MDNKSVVHWKRSELFEQSQYLSSLEMKSYYFSKIDELKNFYQSNISSVKDRRADRIDALSRRLKDKTLKRLSYDYLGIELDFLFEDRFDIYENKYAEAKYVNGRNELIHEALFFANDRKSARKVIMLGLDDNSKLIKLNAVRAAAYSQNSMFLDRLYKICENRDVNLSEDSSSAITAIKKNNHHLFIDRHSTNKSWLIVNFWDGLNSSPPGLQAHLLANSLLKKRDWILSIA